MQYPQTLTIWRKTGMDLNSNPTYSDPETLSVRWEYLDGLILTPEGREVRGNGRIYFPVDTFAIGDMVYDQSVTDTLPPSGSYEIKNKRSISNLSGTEWEHRALI